VLAATRTIQRWLRGWLGRRRADYLRRKKAEREAFLREQESTAQREAEEHRRREIQRRMHPRTAADFEVGGRRRLCEGRGECEGTVGTLRQQRDGGARKSRLETRWRGEG
jgi:hypothetical protein